MNRRRRAPELASAALALSLGLSCGSEPPHGPSLRRTEGGRPAPQATKRTQPRPGLTELDPGAVPRAAVARTVYVAVYSYVYITDSAHPFNLAITPSVRNTD